MKNIKQFNDFAGEDGYLIVDSLSNEVEGGKKKLSDVKNEIISEIPEPPEQVNADWKAESGKAQILNVPDVLKEIPEPDYSSGGIVLSVKSGELRWDWPQIDMDDYVDGETINTDANNSLCVLNPVPDTDDADDGDVLTVENGEPTWKELEIPKVPIESISIGDTELVPDENKNVNIGLGNWLNIDSDNNLYVIPNYGGGTGGLAYNTSYGEGELTVMFDRKTIDRDKDDNLSVHYDDTLTIVEKPVIGSLTAGYLSVKNPVPDTDNANDGDVLTYDSSEGIVWTTPTYLTKAEADTYYAPKSEFDDLVAWLAPISANLVIAASNN